VSSPDPAEYRRASCEQWGRSAAGWGKRREDIQAWGLPVSRWLLDAVRLQPGETVVELAAGPGDTGLLAAELVQPGGRVLISDFADEMLDIARGRAKELGIDNVEFRRLDLESIEIGAGLVDAAFARWGLMLVADPEAGARELRRILKPGGRLALAVWDGPERNPWATIPTQELIDRGLGPQRQPSGPGMFALAPADKLCALLEDAGFTDVVVDGVDLERRHETADEYLDLTRDLSRAFADFVEGADADTVAAVLEGIEARLEAYRQPDGTIVLPARTLVASASA
jgi:SAM-dependent methyltransferase